MTLTTEVLAPTFVLYENGRKVTDKAILASVVRITVDERLDQAGLCTVELSDRGLAFSSGGHLGVGTSLKVELGYVGATDDLFDGEVTGWRESFPRRGAATLVVVALDRFHRLRRERKNKTFCSMKDSDIVQQVLGAQGLQVHADATTVTHDYVMQANQTDADFLLARAGLNGFELKIDGKNATFRKPKLDDPAAVTLKWHEDLTSFTVVVSVAGQHAAVQASAYDMKQKKAVTAKVEAGSEASAMGGQKTGNQVLKDKLSASEPTNDPFRPLLSPEEANLLAQAALDRDSKKFVTGEGRVVGNTKVRRGAVVEIDGIGDYLSGNYYVQTAIHTLVPRLGYTTVFRVQKTSVQKQKTPPATTAQPAQQTEQRHLDAIVGYPLAGSDDGVLDLDIGLPAFDDAQVALGIRIEGGDHSDEDAASHLDLDLSGPSPLDDAGGDDSAAHLDLDLSEPSPLDDARGSTDLSVDVVEPSWGDDGSDTS